MSPEEKRQARDTQATGQPKAGRSDLQDDSEHADGDEKRTDNGMREKAD